MIPSRESPATAPNQDLAELPPLEGETNGAWLARCGKTDGVLLLGGTSLVDFRIRVAQSQLRGDLSPSYWSLCGLLRPGSDTFITVPLQPHDVSDVPRLNGVEEIRLGEIDDPVRWPNIAVVHFAGDTAQILAQVEVIRWRRTILDLPELIVAWLAFGWAAGSADNPLIGGKGVPSAAFVETAHALAGIELTPGLSSASSCPEAVWQAAKWWREYYEGAVRMGGRGSAQPLVPGGVFGVRQRSAAMAIPPGTPMSAAPAAPGAATPAVPAAAPAGPAAASAAPASRSSSSRSRKKATSP